LGFLDESGFLLVPTIARTWAPRGRTPILTTAGSWTKVSAISALTVSPRYRRLGLYCRFHPNKNIRAPQIVQFLKHLLRHIHGHIVLLWDRGLPHRATIVADFLRRNRRLHVHLLPPYAPELNPDELVWNHLKRSLANSIPKDTKDLHGKLCKPVRRLRRSQRLLRSCINASELPWNI
jgi:putative transposase